MNASDTAKVFAYACLFDGRLQADEGKIMAWHTALDPEIPFEWAKYFVGLHYSRTDAVIQPSYFNKDWRIKRDREREKQRTESFFKELEDTKSKVASPEKVDFYLAEIRKVLGKVKDASMEDNSGEVASDQ